MKKANATRISFSRTNKHIAFIICVIFFIKKMGKKYRKYYTRYLLHTNIGTHYSHMKRIE